MMGLQYFIAGIGAVSILHYQNIKKYQEKNDRDINTLLKEHKMIVSQIIKK